MLYTYNETYEKYKNDYGITKALRTGEIFKIEPGIYSDKDFEFELAVISKKYPRAVFTTRSAFYYLGLTDTIPDKYYLATDKDASKIRDSRVAQVFDNSGNLELGMIIREVEGTPIRIYGYERLLLELIRNKSQLPFDYYKEIILNYRKRIDSMDITFMEDMAEKLPKSDLILNTLEMEVL